MKSKILIVLSVFVPLLIFSQGLSLNDSDIAVIQWDESPLNRSIRKNIIGGLPVEVDEYDIRGEAQRVNSVFEEVKNKSYKLVIVIGAQIVTPILKYIPDNRVIIMSSSIKLENIHQRFPNITGVYSFTSPETQLSIIEQIMGNPGKIGIIYNPLHSGTQVDMFQNAIKDTAISIVKNGISSPRELTTALHFMGEINILWLPTDRIYMNKDAMKQVVKYSTDNKIPVFAPYKEYVKQGAIACSSASAISLEILSIIASLSKGTEMNEVNPRFPSGSIVLNKKVASEIGIIIPEEILSRAEEVYE